MLGLELVVLLGVAVLVGQVVAQRFSVAPPSCCLSWVLFWDWSQPCARLNCRRT